MGALTHFVAQHTNYFILHGFSAIRVEVYFNLVGGFADCLYRVGLFGSWVGDCCCRLCGGCIHFVNAHIIIVLSRRKIALLDFVTI